MTSTTHITVTVTPRQKRRVEAHARAAGLSTSEYLCRAADAYPLMNQEALLENMLDEMVKAAAKTNSTIDDALAFVAESNRRIEAMTARHSGDS